MDEYVVNKNAQETGEHEVHKTTCDYLPEIQNQLHLGYFYDCHDAVKKAEETYSNVDGCYYCCLSCHTR